MTRSMFGIRYKPDAEILRPFRAWVSWLCHSIGLHPILEYYAPSWFPLYSPERASYTNDGYSPSYIGITNMVSPERARYISEAVSPLAKYNSEAVLPLVIKKEK